MTQKSTISLILCLLTIAVFSTGVLAATLSREIPSRVDPGSEFTAKIVVPDAVADKTLTIEETLPKGVTLKTWDITGTKESKSQLQADPKKYRVKDGSYGWSVTPTGPVTITYTLAAPQTEGSLDFDAVYFDPSGFNHNAYKLSVAKEVAPAPAPEPTPSPAPAPAAAPAPQPSKPVPQTPPPSKGNLAYMVGILALVVLGAVGWYYYSQNKK